jgi:branched-chain amino acid aminotransferase
MQEADKIWLDGALVDWAEAKVHVLSHVLHYGSGVFEGIRAYETDRGTGVFCLTAHLERMRRSASLYHMEIPFRNDELAAAVHDTIAVNALPSCYVRPIAFRGYGELGINPLNCPVQVAIAVWPWGAYLGEEAFETGVRAMISSWRRIGPNTIPAAAKGSGQYLNSQLAKIEAIKHGYDEAILLNEAGMIADGTGENVFVVHRGRLLTPPTAASCLPGITRETIIRLAAHLGHETVEREITRSDLYFADEVFLTGTAAEVTPVASVDDHQIGPGPVTKAIQAAFFDLVHGRSPLSAEYLEYPAGPGRAAGNGASAPAASAPRQDPLSEDPEAVVGDPSTAR